MKGLVCGLAICASVPAAAQTYAPPTGSILRQAAPAQLNSTTVDQGLDNARMLASLAACLADSQPVAVRDYLGRAPGSRQAERAAGFFETSDCIVNAKMRIQRSLFRQALFAGLYLHDFGRAAPATPDPALKIDYADRTISVDQAHLLMMQFGDCVDRTDPAGTRAFLLAGAGSAQETAAIGALKPALSDCLAPGASITFGRASLRGYLGEAAYRLARAAGATPAPSPALAKVN